MTEFARMPGIGSKTAERLAYYILRADREQAMALAYAIRDVKKNVRHCSLCFNLAEQDPCPICADSRRDVSTICVVEQPKDLIAFELTGRYRGLYHVLLGRLAPLDGVEPEHLTIASLLERVRKKEVAEVILALNPDLEGDGTALLLAERLKPLGVAVTRLARGLPTGGSIEFANSAVLSDALTERRRFSSDEPSAPPSEAENSNPPRSGVESLESAAEKEL